jgi:tetratricopeptide (TPR) repeat protein
LAAAGVDGGDVTGDLEKFAKAYAGTALGERAVINALLAARASGDSKTLYRLAGEFEKKYPKSLQLSAIRATIARTAASRFELDQAVTFFVKSAEGKGAQKGPLLIAAGNLKAQLADVDGAKEAFKAALSAADTTAAKNQAVQPLVKLLERQGQYDAVITTIGKLGEEADPNTLAYLGIAQIRKGKGDEGEATLQKVLDGGPSASTEARARAYFGQAEVFNKALLGFNPGGDLETIQELVTLLEVTEQAYLKAAREGSALYTAAAFARLAFVSETTAKRMREIKLPPGVDQKLGVALKTGFSRRADRLDRQAKEAVAGCAEQGWIHHNFNAAVRVCLTGKIPPNNPITFSPLKPRRPSKGSPKLEALRVRLSKNPEDLDALRSIGEDFLTNGDFHAARLVFDRASQVGGGPLEANLLGIASFKAGDIAGGLNAFARAASGGLSVARDNLAAALRSVGLTSAAADALKRFTGGRPGGRKLNGAGG